MSWPAVSPTFDDEFRQQIGELRGASEAIAEWCGEALTVPMTPADTLRCFSDIVSCLTVAVDCVNHLSQEVGTIVSAEADDGEAAALRELMDRLTGLADEEQWQQLSPLVSGCRALANRLDPQQ